MEYSEYEEILQIGTNIVVCASKWSAPHYSDVRCKIQHLLHSNGQSCDGHQAQGNASAVAGGLGNMSEPPSGEAKTGIHTVIFFE